MFTELSTLITQKFNETNRVRINRPQAEDTDRKTETSLISEHVKHELHNQMKEMNIDKDALGVITVTPLVLSTGSAEKVAWNAL